ncbi:uncharacterized protein ASCRUDRAFT_80442 [Ascoidea rubescens DSM 1968]|uniref:Uncharacterized protein n=1 Tax=Ascoidea rubescens DSM 1968 TaxID=1344418 RepID=A0A1D2VI84_9ASCO|nr:hypothetical protein ASCRUDRAFT_80442 [Ascoidea rubescens DSM 1968]ODV61325.1 hypothetical protein ASCRUDRAFT_80442 [Ascoidea rubescens DSM 1968]
MSLYNNQDIIDSPLEDTLAALLDCVKSLSNCATYAESSSNQLDKLLQPIPNYSNNSSSNSPTIAKNEFERLSNILKYQKVYKLYPVSLVNNQIKKYKNFKNNEIILIIERLNNHLDIKFEKRLNLINQIELLEKNLKKLQDYNNNLKTASNSNNQSTPNQNTNAKNEKIESDLDMKIPLKVSITNPPSEQFSNDENPNQPLVYDKWLDLRGTQEQIDKIRKLRIEKDKLNFQLNSLSSNIY